MSAGVKPGVYREPVHGHTVEYFAGAEVVPPGYAWIASSEDYAAGKGPAFKPVDRWDHSRSLQPEMEQPKAKTVAQNKARQGTQDKA